MVRISRSISESPLDFEITRVDCIVVFCVYNFKAHVVKFDQTPCLNLGLRRLIKSILLDITLSSNENCPNDYSAVIKVFSVCMLSHTKATVIVYR